MHWVCLPFTKRTTAPTCVVVAKCRDARLRIIFSVRSSRRGLPAAQHCCSEKSSQLQSNMSYAFVIYFVTFYDILWQFLSFFKSMCLMGNVRGAKSAWFLVFPRVLKSPFEEKPRLVPLGTSVVWKVLGRSLGRMGMMTASKIWPTTMTPHISTRQQVQRLSIWRLFVHRWPRLLHAFVTVDGRYFSGNRNSIAHINFCQLSYSATRCKKISCPILALSTFVLID